MPCNLSIIHSAMGTSFPQSHLYIGLSAAPSASASPGKSEVYDTDARREGEGERGRKGRKRGDGDVTPARAPPPPRNHAKRCPHGHGPIYICFPQSIGRQAGRHVGVSVRRPLQFLRSSSCRASIQLYTVLKTLLNVFYCVLQGVPQYCKTQ